MAELLKSKGGPCAHAYLYAQFTLADTDDQNGAWGKDLGLFFLHRNTLQDLKVRSCFPI